MTTLDGRRVAYQDAWARAHRGGDGATGVTWARANPYIDWMHWLRPERRLDYIFTTQVRRDRRGTVHGARVVFDEPRVDGGRRARVRVGSLRRRRGRADGGGAGPCGALSAAAMFLLAHVTDPHFRGFAGASPADFVNKRALGTLNLLVNRTRKHKMELLEALRAGHARAGARPPGADGRFRRTCRCRASGARRWRGSTPAGSSRRRSA